MGNKILFFVFLVLSVTASFAQQDTVRIDSLVPIPKDTAIYFSKDFKQFKEQVGFENKPYIIFFTASWCAPCHKIKEEALTHPKIVQLLNDNYLLYMLDMENFDDMEVNEKDYHIQQLPTLLIFNPKGQLIDKAIGYYEPYYLFKKIRNQLPPYKQGKDWLQN